MVAEADVAAPESEAAEQVAEAAAPTPVDEPSAAEPTAESGDGPVESLSTEATAEAAAPAEEVLIEVWRPHRHHHGRRPQHEHGRPGGGGRPQRGPRGAQTGDATTPPAEGAAPTGERPHRSRPHGARQGEGGEGRRFEGRRPDAPRGDRPPRQGEGRPDRPQGGAPNREGRGDRGPRRPERGGERANFTTEAPRGRERAPDPNSPFAKLAALKAQLEGKSGKGSDGKGSE